jgi:mannose-6-phosphate isomerase-like protein (cupin superfamily)
MDGKASQMAGKPNQPGISMEKGEKTMSENASFPYETRLNILHGPLEVINEKAIADACEYDWYNQTLCRVNDAVVRLGVVKGEYHWHKHDDDDEFFYVIDGNLLIDLEDRTVELSPRQGFVVPKGTMHRTRAIERTSILMVENYGIIPTGN